MRLYCFGGKRSGIEFMRGSHYVATTGAFHLVPTAMYYYYLKGVTAGLSGSKAAQLRHAPLCTRQPVVSPAIPWGPTKQMDYPNLVPSHESKGLVSFHKS
jgi:hypothetical protein